MAAGDEPGSGLGDAKRAVSFFHSSVARDSCPGSADDDELYRHSPQQGDAEATGALHRVTLDGHVLTVSRLLPGTDTPLFIFWVCRSNRGLKRQCQRQCQRASPARWPAIKIGQSLLLEKHMAKALIADSQAVKSQLRREVFATPEQASDEGRIWH